MPSSPKLPRRSGRQRLEDLLQGASIAQSGKKLQFFLYIEPKFRCDTDLRLTSSEILRHKRSCGIKAESKTLVSDYM